MPVLAHPPSAPPPHLPHSKLSATSLTQPAVDMDDLLAETLAEADGSPGLEERDYTDDLEDIVSMSVAQELHSRRSRSQMQTYLPSSPPLPAPISPPVPPSSTRFSPSPSPYASETDDPSTPQSSTLNRSPSAAAGKNGKRRPSAIPRPGGGGRGADGKHSRTPSPELGRRKGSLPLDTEMRRTPSTEPPAEEEGEGEKWETLQVGSPPPPVGSAKRKAQSVSPARPGGSPAPNGTRPGAAKTPKSTPSSGGMSRSKSSAVDFPPTSASSSAPCNLGGSSGGTPTRGRPRPSAGSTSTSKPSPSSASSSTPRKRAQTSLANGASSSPLAGNSSPSPSASAGGANKPRPSATSRTQTSITAGSRASPRTGTGPPPARRKSLSTTQELASLRSRAGADPLTSASLPSAAPEWSLEPAPLVYRTSKGDLAFGKEAEREMQRRGVGREEAIVPAVARRLEAERLARLQGNASAVKEEGEGEGDMLVTEWGPDGRPRRAVDWRGRKLVAGANGQLKPEGEGENGGEGGPLGETPPSVEPAKTPPPSAGMPLTDGQQPQQPSLTQPLDAEDPRRGSIPFQSYLPPRTTSSSHPGTPAAVPSTPRPAQQQSQQPISLNPVPPAAGTNEKQQQKEKRPTAQADDDALGKKKGGCCGCLIS